MRIFPRFRPAGVLALVVVLGVSAVAVAGAEDPWVGQPSPDFTVTDLEGNQYALEDLKGSGVIWLNFWGLRCGPCIRELPALQEIYRDYKDQGLLILGVNADGVDAEFIRKQLETRADLQAAGVTFPLVTDLDFALIDAFGLMGAPLNVMIDRQGIVRFRHEGYEDGDEKHYRELVQQFLAE